MRIMRSVLSYAIAAALIGIVIIGAGIFQLTHKRPAPAPIAKVIVAPEKKDPIEKSIGKSVQGRAITSYTYGKGSKHVVFVGGIHGGYEWNSVILAYQFKDYLDAHPNVSQGLTITVIPDANPDGVFKVIGKEGRFTTADVPSSDSSPGRFNAHDVDLNRNFDCKWKSTGTWKQKTVSAGTVAFSEPEAAAIRDYVIENKPDAFVFWHSQAGRVYASQCKDGILPKTLEIMKVYANAAGYPAVESFDAYEVNGASEDWLASIGIPTITVELKTHDTVEWDKNLAGSMALLEFFRKL